MMSGDVMEARSRRLGYNVETPSAELCSCRRDKHVVAFCRTKICPTRNAGEWDADVVEVGRTVLTDSQTGSQNLLGISTMT